jgi:hypothetical protein
MVSRSSDSFHTEPTPQPSLKEVPTVMHDVMVPVFIKVSLPADDACQAECLAVERVREIGSFVREGVTFQMASVIAPISAE